MNSAQRHHYDAIQQLARDEWPAEDERDSVVGDEAEAAR